MQFHSILFWLFLDFYFYVFRFLFLFLFLFGSCTLPLTWSWVLRINPQRVLKLTNHLDTFSCGWEKMLIPRPVCMRMAFLAIAYIIHTYSKGRCTHTSAQTHTHTDTHTPSNVQKSNRKLSALAGFCQIYFAQSEVLVLVRVSAAAGQQFASDATYTRNKNL